MSFLHPLTVVGIASMLLLSSCVSTKKYRAALERETGLISRTDEMNRNISRLNNRIDSMENENARLTRQIDDALRNANQQTGLANLTQK